MAVLTRLRPLAWMVLVCVVAFAAGLFGQVGSGPRVTPQGQFYAANGTAGAPTLAFANDTEVGLFMPAASRLGFAVNGQTDMEINWQGTYEGVDLGVSRALKWGTAFNASDTYVRRTAAGSVGIETTNGQAIGLSVATELTTIAAAATTDTTITIPANAIVVGVSVRVTTVIPTAATFTVTGATSGTAFQTGASVSTVADTTDVGTKSCPYLNTAAQSIRITPNAQPADTTGRVRVTIHYLAITAPTS